jgi:hypothetical protein
MPHVARTRWSPAAIATLVVFAQCSRSQRATAPPPAVAGPHQPGEGCREITFLPPCTFVSLAPIPNSADETGEIAFHVVIRGA